MKTLFMAAAVALSLTASSQYYYKDIIGTRESAELITAYRNNKVRTVALNSYTVNNTPLNNFSIQQEFLPALQALRTITKSEYTSPSYLTSYIDAAGRVIKTTDSTDGIVNTTLYSYNAAGHLTAVSFAAGDTLAAVKTDDHLWQYDAKNSISRMLRIKNKKDTAVVTFKLDAKGNVIEEQEKRRVSSEEPYQYYYDEANRLTDIVRYNKNAGRLLPEAMFEYSEKNQVIQRYTIPPNSDDYLIWRFAYDNKGLKTKEVVFNKQKEQTGKVEYVYTFSN
jgi:YD repeat-containing protein